MTAQEWLEEHRKRDMAPREENEAATIIRTLLAEVDRLKNVIANDLPFLVHENDLLHCRNKSWKAKVDRLQSLAASRLADQVAIERHTEKRVAEEILDIVGYCESFADLRSVIWQKYGVD